MLITIFKRINMFLGAHGVQQVPPMPPEKVREFQLSNRFNRWPRRKRPMNYKMRYNFQDQTFAAKLITPPKSTYKLRLNGLCHIPGTFYEARSVKF